jgi:triosephosphate isomerase
MRGRLVAGNWKMNGSLAANLRLLETLKKDLHDGGVQHTVCVPYPYLAQVEAALTGTPVAWGAQNLSEHAQGAYTGEVSGAMLRDFGCRHVIVGHSERRADCGETDAVVRAKAEAAWRAGLLPIICIGETLAEREAGKTLAVLEGQLKGSVPAGASAARLVVAYEPVWAIGTGKTPTTPEVGAAHAHIRKVLGEMLSDAAAVRLLYGGSVKGSNAAELLAAGDVDGALVGGASLMADEFLAIAKAAQSG